jgi:2-polyprenyl-6-methoxyphenol hydroxylase-like FAD-dependent oxidoreductase
LEVIIAGGGIGGLTAALCLARAGIGVTVYEAASELRPLGLGINVQAGAIRLLSERSLEPALAASAIETRELIYMNRHGQTIWSDPRRRFARLPWPQFSIHHGELQLILHRAAVPALGPDRVRTGHRLVDFVEADGRVTAQFTGPDGAPAATATGDALIGADGIHSRVRAKFHPEEGRRNGTA